MAVLLPLVRVQGQLRQMTAGDSLRLPGALNYAPQVVLTTQGAVDIAGAAGNYVLLSGSGSTINTLGSGDDGMRRVVRFNGVNTLKHADDQILLPGSADIVTAENDLAEFYCRSGNSWRCLWYTRADGRALVESASAISADADNRLIAGTDGKLFVSDTLNPDPLMYYILARS